MIGTIIEGEYRIDGVIGSGASSTVYRCHDLRLERTVALKMRHHASNDDREIRRFFSESRNLAALNHPNVIQIYRLGELDGSPFLVMEYLAGRTLREVMKDARDEGDGSAARVSAAGGGTGGGTFPDVAGGLDIMLQVARGLGAIHGQGILHRDLSPNNVMLTESGQAKILDLGLSKDTRVPPTVFSENVLAGTISYIAPELVHGEPASFASDVFSFGVILYEVISRQNPFQAEHVTAVLYNTTTRRPEPLDRLVTGLPAGLSDLVDACLEKAPQDRPRDVTEIEKKLARFLSVARGGGPAPSLLPGRPRARRFRNPYCNRVMIKRTADFFGRIQETHRIFARLNATPPGSISIVGDRKIGKSSLLNFVYNGNTREALLQKPDKTIMVFLDFQQEKNMTLAGFVQILLGMAALELRGRLDVSDCPRDLDGIKILVQRLDAAGYHLVLLLDEFDAITTNPNFNLEFFSFLRYLANHFNVAYLTSSSRDLQELCHTKEISDSPFFNIFTSMRLGLFRLDEALDLIRSPSARIGCPLAVHEDAILEMAGLYPFYLQVACSHMIDYLEEQRTSRVTDFIEVRRRFYEEAKLHYRYIWESLDVGERSALLRVANGRDLPPSTQPLLDKLSRRCYIVRERDHQRLFAGTFSDFVREEARGDRRPGLLDRFRRRRVA